MLPTGAALMLAGLISTIIWPIAGLYIERAGLIGMAITIMTLLYALIVNAHISLISLTAINTGTTVLIVILRFAIIGSTLDSFKRRIEEGRD